MGVHDGRRRVGDPAVDESKVYAPDWAGNLYALDRATGAQVWSKQVSEYTGVPGDLARVTPAVAGNRLILGNQRNFGNLFPDPGAYVFAVNKNTGALLEDEDRRPLRRVRDPVGCRRRERRLRGRVLPRGGARRLRAYPCCSFRGSFLALDVTTGAILWKTYMVPTGDRGAVWGSTAAVDKARKTVYITTGNNYTAPQDVLDCVENAPSPEDARACMPADDYFDSVLALDTATGAIKWVTQALPSTPGMSAASRSSVTVRTAPSLRGPTTTSARGRRCSR